MSLVFGFFLGFSTCIALIAGVIYYFVTNILDFPGADGKTQLERRVENDLANPPSVKETSDLISKVFQDPKVLTC